MNNSILTIHPYKVGSVWMFDDERVDIKGEPFVGNINLMIDRMLTRAGLIASEPFTAMFSADKFPGAHMWLQHQREEDGGNWYHDETTKMQGWLCPVLCYYFDAPPKNIYVRAEP